MSPKSDGKENFRKAADKFSEDAAAFYAEVLGATKEVSIDVPCEKCPGFKHRVKVPIADWTARTNALSKLLEAGYGKAPSAKDPGPPPAHLKLEDVDALSDSEISLGAWEEGDTVEKYLVSQARKVLAALPGTEDTSSLR